MDPEYQWLEDKGGFTRYALDDENSFWVCAFCGSEDVDPDEGICYLCDEEAEDKQ